MSQQTCPDDPEDCYQDQSQEEQFCLLTVQLFNGCRREDCTYQYCATGRRNNSHGVPTRDYSLRTAQALALQLLDGSSPNRYLRLSCHRLASKTTPDILKGPRDPSSFSQRMSDSLGPAFDQARSQRSQASSRWTEIWQAVAGLEVLLRRPFHPGTGGKACPKFVSNAKAADLIGSALVLIYDAIPPDAHEISSWNLAAEQINNGRAIPGHIPKQAPGNTSTGWLSLLDFFESEPVLALGAKICECVAFRYRIDDISRRVESLGEDSTLRSLISAGISRIASHYSRPNGPWAPWPYPLLLKKIFLKHWNGEPIIERGTVASGALELMESLQQISDSIHHQSAKKSGIHAIPSVAKRLNPPDMAETWMRLGGNTTKAKHILHYPFIFTEGQLLMYFRTTCHLRMRDAHIKNGTHDNLYERMIAANLVAATIADSPDFSSEMKYHRTHYILLNVSRDNVLGDAFDQLWQRRKGELERPLRVRLGETEGMEVGHDLGGVQIEFFGAICREAFSEDYGMFTTDPITGLSWYRPGSLQPLHMFELFGLLLALALYNGITLPVSFPLIFYKQLLGKACSGLDDIKDGWPEVVRGLEACQRGEVNLDLELPLEANGLRLSFTLEAFRTIIQQAKNRPHYSVAPLELPYSEISLIKESPSPSTSIKASTSATYITAPWPGWRLTPHRLPPPPETSSRPSTSQAYAQSYALWLTQISVSPQLAALLTGFHTLLPPSSLSLFTPATLKRTLEGSSVLDLKALRRSTTYDGFSAGETYIQSFWRVVGKWDAAMQKGLLKFVTAAERVPISGGLGFRISRAEGGGGDGEEEDNGRGLLPTSSTCFGTLYLPRYKDEAELERKLKIAIEWGGVGFGTG